MSRNILQASLVALSVAGAPSVLAQESTPQKVEQIVSGNPEFQKNLEQLLSCESGGGCFGPAGLHLGIVNGTTAIIYNGFDPQDPRKASYISLVDFSNLIGATPSKQDMRRALEQFVRDTKTHPENTIHLEEEVVAGVQVGNTMKDLVVMNDGTSIDQLRIRGGVEASTLRGMIIRAGVTSELGSSGAVSVDIRVGSKEREILTQLGFEVANGMMVKVSFAHLEQFMQFAFSDETLSHTMKQDTLGLSLRIPGNEVFRFFELSGYVIHAGSHDFADKYYTIDLGTAEELWSLRRRAAGSNTVGVAASTQIALTEDGRFTLDLSVGAERVQYLTLDHSAAQVSPTGGARLSFPVTENINGHVQVRGSRGMFRGEIGGTYGKSQFGVFVEQQSGQQRNAGIALSLRGGNTDTVQDPTSNPVQKDIFANMPLPTYTAPQGIADYVTARPNWVPTQVRAKADEKRELVRRTLKNQSPTAVNDTATVISGNSVLVNVLANDTDPENDTLALVSFTQPTHGAVVRIGNQLQYTPTAGYTGTDSFTYVMTDGTTNASPATVNITVNPVPNTAPTAIGFSPVSLTAGSLSVGQNVGTLTCTDAESATCTYVLSAQSTAGAFAVASNGAVTVANAGLTAGTHTITVVATDAGGLPRTETKNIVVSAAPVDRAEVVTLPTPTITATAITFVGGSVTDSDNPGGFTPSISYLVTDASGNPVSASSLTPNTAYAWQMQYTTYDGATNTLTVKRTTKQNFTTLALADTTAPSLTSSPTLSATNIGTTVSHTLTFDEAINTVSVGIVPSGMTVTATKSGSSVTLDIATTASFTAFGSVTIPLTVTDNASPANSRTVNINKIINDVAPVAGGAFASLADMTVSDAAGLSPIVPINAGGVTDSLGRTITYSASGLPSGLSIDSITGVISGIHDAFGNEQFTVTVIASNGTSQIQKTFILTVRDDG